MTKISTRWRVHCEGQQATRQVGLTMCAGLSPNDSSMSYLDRSCRLLVSCFLASFQTLSFSHHPAVMRKVRESIVLPKRADHASMFGLATRPFWRLFGIAATDRPHQERRHTIMRSTSGRVSGPFGFNSTSSVQAALPSAFF